MGMVLCLKTVSDRTIEQLLKDPESIEDLLNADITEDESDATDEGIDCDLDKAWHAVHFLLAGDSEGGDWPEGFLLIGGEVVGDVEVGYGPARVLTSKEVKVVHRMLDALPVDKFRKRFDARALERADVYPSIWDRNDPGDIEYVCSNYERLRSHVAGAASKGMGLAIWIG